MAILREDVSEFSGTHPDLRPKDVTDSASPRRYQKTLKLKVGQLGDTVNLVKVKSVLAKLNKISNLRCICWKLRINTYPVNSEIVLASRVGHACNFAADVSCLVDQGFIVSKKTELPVEVGHLVIAVASLSDRGHPTSTN